MLSARKRTKTPVAPTCQPKSPYFFFFGEPDLFFQDLLRARPESHNWPVWHCVTTRPIFNNTSLAKQVYIIEKTLSSNYITWKKEIYSEHWRMVMPSFSPPVVRDNKQFETTIYTTFKHWLVTTTDINSKTRHFIRSLATPPKRPICSAQTLVIQTRMTF